MKAGITGYGAYIPRMRMCRRVIADANAWFAPGLTSKGKGTRSFANWDEDAVTQCVAAARDLFGPEGNRDAIDSVCLVSDSLPFAERRNSGILAAALRLPDSARALDITGSQSAPLQALDSALSEASTSGRAALLTVASQRITRAASPQELAYGDGAAAIRIGTDDVIAEVVAIAHQTEDFVDRFRRSDEAVDYHWEERWVREQGIMRVVPNVIQRALADANIRPELVETLIFPCMLAKADVQVAKSCGIDPSAVVDNLASSIGDCGAAQGLLMLADCLEKAKPGQLIVLAQFGGGASALVLRVTDAIERFRPVRGVSGWLGRGQVEENYTRFLSYKGQLELEKGMRGEQDNKTALSTAWRHQKALLGFVAGRCRETGAVHFPPSRISYSPSGAIQNTQDDWCLAERHGTVLSWSAEYLSSYMSPPHHYGQVDFDGGGRLLMEFTDVRPGDIDGGTKVEMVFRIKSYDELRGYQRYFWKAAPVRYGIVGEDS